MSEGFPPSICVSPKEILPRDQPPVSEVGRPEESENERRDRLARILFTSGSEEKQKAASATTVESLPVVQVQISDARSLYRFDMGHPMENTLYIHNPCLPGHYILAAVASERFTQEKIAAFTDIAASLGAKTISLISGAINEEAGTANTTLEAVATRAGLNAEFSDKNKVQRGVMMEFGPPREKPHIPEELEPWLRQDPLLRIFVKTRLRQNLRHSKITLQLREQFEFAADLSAKFLSFGVSVGGDYHHVTESTWLFEVEFFSKEGLGQS